MEGLDMEGLAAAAVGSADDGFQLDLVFDEYRRQLPQDVADGIAGIIQVCTSAGHTQRGRFERQPMRILPTEQH